MDDLCFHLEPTRKGTFACLTLNRPQALNALTLAMCTTLETQLIHYAKHEDIAGVLLAGTGAKAFCAGGDIRTIYQLGRARAQEALAFFAVEYRLNQLIFTYSKPFIALMQGITFGGGAGISVHGSLRIAARDLCFAMPETGIGFFPDVGMCYQLARCPAPYGLYLALTGISINASDALLLGLVDSIVDDAKPATLLARINQTPYSLSQVLHNPSVLNPCVTPPIISLPSHETMGKAFTQNTIAAIMAYLQTQQSTWANNTLSLLEQRSPTSLAVTHELISRAKTLSFKECIAMEYYATQQFLQHEDFYEGIRAAIIDKDKQPKWLPINNKEIARFFQKDQQRTTTPSAHSPLRSLSLKER